MAINIGNSKTKVYLGNKNLKIYLGTEKIYPCGNVVTYYVDTEEVYQEEVGEGESCLQLKNFTPSKSGWEFAGWRQDTTANGSVLKDLKMKDAPVTLYAVFKQTVTIDYDGNENTGGDTSQQNEYMYYNNGNLEEAAFKLSKNGFTRKDHIFVCWAYGSPSGTQCYNEGDSISLSNNTTFYAIWEADLSGETAKSAPPFLGAGWRTLFTNDYIPVSYENGITSYKIVTQDDGTRWISKDKISTDDPSTDDPYYWIDASETKKGYIFYLPTPIDTSTYSNFSFVEEDIAFDDDISEGRLIDKVATPVSRFSDDGTTWGEYWDGRTTPDRSYKYAQVGFFIAANNDASVSMWVKCIITSFTIQ